MTTKNEISVWFDRGIQNKATHMIVCVDTFDWEDYPVYANSDEQALNAYNAHNDVNMQRVMEVYDLRKDKQEQLEQNRVWNLPK